MPYRHPPLRAELGVRTTGIFLCCVSAAAISRLYALRSPPQNADLFAYLLALVGFLSASIGASMLFVGRALFDEMPAHGTGRGTLHSRSHLMIPSPAKQPEK